MDYQALYWFAAILACVFASTTTYFALVAFEYRRRDKA